MVSQNGNEGGPQCGGAWPSGAIRYSDSSAALSQLKFAPGQLPFLSVRDLNVCGSEALRLLNTHSSSYLRPLQLLSTYSTTYIRLPELMNTHSNSYFRMPGVLNTHSSSHRRSP